MPEDNAMMKDPLSGLLASLLGGHPVMQDHMQQTGQSLDQVLGGISSMASTAAGGGPAGGSLVDILGNLLGGSPQAGGAPGAGGDPLSAILGSLLGGGVQPSGVPQQSGGGDLLSSILSGLLGGGMQGAMGSPSTGALGNNSFLAPIVDAIAERLGFPRQIAEAVVSFALNQVMGGQRDPQLAHVLGRKGAVSQRYLRDSGLAKQLALQTGMDQKTAARSLREVLQAFGTQMGDLGTMHERHQNLRSWLQPGGAVAGVTVGQAKPGTRPVGAVAGYSKSKRGFVGGVASRTKRKA